MVENSKGKRPSRWRRRISSALLVLAVVWTVWFVLRQGLFSKDNRHILLISIDTCRADHLSCYGFYRRTTPNIDAVAKEAVIFEHAVSPVPLTLPAHGSMLTGVNPTSHGVHDNIGYKLDGSSQTVAEILQEDGYTTGAIISSFVLDAQFGLAQGFDTYNDDFVRPMSSFYHSERRGDEASYFACDWLEAHCKEPFFLFLHYYDPHHKYRPPEPFATNFKDNPYAGEIAYVDYCIGQVIEKLKKLGLYDSTLLIITGDHGEGLEEHQEKTHGYFIYQSTLHVPLIVKVPAGRGSKRVDEAVSLIDIVPTICSLSGIRAPATVQGKDLSRCFKKRGTTSKSERYIYCESLYPTQYGCSALLGLVTDGWKYIQAPREELYDLSKDPGETENLAEQQAGRTRLLQEHLKTILQDELSNNKQKSRLTLDPQSKRRLESLGYLASGDVRENFEFDNTKEDPKDWVTVHGQVMWVNTYIKAKQYPEAEAICRQILEEHPQFVLNDFLLGKIAFERNNVAESITHFSRFLARTGGTDNRDSGDKPFSLNDLNVCEAHEKLGMAFFQQGNFEQAVIHYSRVLEMKPDDPETYYNLGNVYLKQRDFEQAIMKYNKTLELNPDLPQVHNNLGNIYFRRAEFDKAIMHYEKALAVDPDLYEAGVNLKTAKTQKTIALWEQSLREDANQPSVHSNLGVVFYSQGNSEKAVYHWEKALELKPDNIELMNSLAWVRATNQNEKLRDPNEALRLAKRACELINYKRPDFLDTLAAAYAAGGRFDIAVETAQEAIELAQSENQRQLITEIQKHLEHYKRGQAYFDLVR